MRIIVIGGGIGGLTTAIALTKVGGDVQIYERALIAATQEDSILRNDVYDLAPMPRFVQGRVALLGDSAHATTPNLGQGACQAIEDSVVIAASLKTAGGVEPGLQEYERRRMPRVSQISLRSRNMGVVAQLENPAACWLRDSLVRIAPNGAALRQMKSLLGVEILTPAEQSLFRGITRSSRRGARTGWCARASPS